ncbi:hypothetical protein ACNVED_08400 [Legionella sp. D16C41]|uniref:hypothetical protein n=1 Tax=Legionella sp. D16C41 TaxID=3402688 RepID=UPI003AF59EBF
MYDGHGGSSAAIYVANNIGTEFKKQCTLKQEEYDKQPLSVYNNRASYNRDNWVVDRKKDYAVLQNTATNEQQITNIYAANLNMILNMIESHNYDLGRGISGKEGYSHSAFKIKNIIDKALDDVSKGKQISHNQYSRIVFDIEMELSGKLKETKGVTLFGWGKRTATTVALYESILTSVYPIIKQPVKNKPPMEKSYKDIEYYIGKRKFN